MTDDEKRELLGMARRHEALYGDGFGENGVVRRLADALEGTLTEPEWEERVEYGQMTSLGFFPEIRGRNYATHQRTVRWSEPVPVWDVVTDDRD